jgi:hypothetical protein
LYINIAGCFSIACIINDRTYLYVGCASSVRISNESLSRKVFVKKELGSIILIVDFCIPSGSETYFPDFLMKESGERTRPLTSRNSFRRERSNLPRLIIFYMLKKSGGKQEERVGRAVGVRVRRGGSSRLGMARTAEYGRVRAIRGLGRGWREGVFEV